MNGSLLSGGFEPQHDQPLDATAPAAGEEQGPAGDLDLDRLVWDPEYRKAMGPLIKGGG